MRRQQLARRSKSPLGSGRGKVAQEVGLAANEVGIIRVAAMLGRGAGTLPSAMEEGVKRREVLASEAARQREGGAAGTQGEEGQAGVGADWRGAPQHSSSDCYCNECGEER
jgi:hypothetical protein